MDGANSESMFDGKLTVLVTKYGCFPTETAENIGYSCNMLREEMKEIFIVSASTAEEVKEELR